MFASHLRSTALAGLLAICASAGAADPGKVLHWVFGAAETGFDPAKVSDVYSAEVIEAINEPLLTYDYLARPAKLVPRTAEALPAVTDSGKTYTLRVKRGIYFTPDPAFRGKKHELTAADYVYSIERLVDPAIRSPYAFLVAGKVVGLDELAERARKNDARFDYDAKVAGLESVDRYTLRIRLKETDYNFSYILAMPTLAAVARSVIEAYPDATNAHPVGTGPYLLKSWVPASKIVLAANPDFRPQVWNFAPGADPLDQQIAAAMKGKSIPQIGVIEISIIEEPQTAWLAFQQGEVEILALPAIFAPIALPANKLSPELAAKGVRLQRSVEPVITYTGFNMKDPVIGGYSKEKIALRRALAMAYDTDQEIDVIRNHQAFKLEMPIPPGVVGYDENYRSSIPHNPAAANRLLDLMGYGKGSDGWRVQPDGRPLVLHLAIETDSISRQHEELWKRTADGLGLHIEFDKGKFSDHIRAAKACQLQIWGQAWTADYPDGDNFMQLLYGPHVGESNSACYQSPQFDKFYEQARMLADSPERNRLYREMSRQIEVDDPWMIGVGLYRNALIQPQVEGYKKHPILNEEWMYFNLVPKPR